MITLSELSGGDGEGIYSLLPIMLLVSSSMCVKKRCGIWLNLLFRKTVNRKRLWFVVFIS